MDRREKLKTGHELSFKGFNCTIESVVGAGSNGVVYKAWYPDELNRDKKHYVLIKELFPFHPKGGIFRDDRGSIVIEEDAREYYELHKKSFEYGNAVHLGLLEKYPEKTGANINTYFLNNTMYTIMGFSGGRSLEEEIKNGGKKSLREIAVAMLGVLNSLESFHEENLLHMDISPDNILVIGKGEYERYMLIDYNGVHSLNLRAKRTHEYYSAKQGFSAPEVRGGHIGDIGFVSDIYSVGAVFYSCLTKNVLTQTDMLRRTPPDVSKTEFVKDMPDSVKSMVRKILCRTLATLCDKRYQSVSELKAEFTELIDRIDGVGITHWALWEAGRANILKAVKNNVSLEYIKNTDNLYRVDVLMENKERISFDAAINMVVEKKKKGLVFEGVGGSGKTTALLRTIYEQSGKYTSNSTAFTYISLYGLNNDENFIKNKILENLHFKADVKTFEMARNKLKKLIEEPILSGGKEIPKIVVFLDGLNEATGDIGYILKEIEELCQLDGIGFIVSTRSGGADLPFEAVKVLPLADSEVEKALSKNGLLLPENNEVKVLLKTPLMLSAYIETARNKGGQVIVGSKDELIREYIDNLCAKEMKNLAENDEEKWLIDASVKVLLPALANEISKKNHALGDQELLKVAKKCYRIISSVIMSRAFPEWIGRTAAIKAGAKTSDEWYGMSVQKMLWQKMGLLSRDEDELYRICHQEIQEFLVERYKENTKKLLLPKIFIGTTIAVCALAVLSGIFVTINYVYPDLAETSIFVRWKAMDEEEAQKVIEHSFVGYQQSGVIYEYIYELINESEYYMAEHNYNKCIRFMDDILSDGHEGMRNYAVENIDKLTAQGTVLPWSYKEFDADAGKKLVIRPKELAQKYNKYLKYYKYAYEKGDAEYINALNKVLEADGDLSSALYHYCCSYHLSKMEKDDNFYTSLIESVATMTKQEKHRNKLMEMNTDIDMQFIANMEKTVREAENKMQQLMGKYEILYK